ncbi:50S ribosomal protein L32 [Wenzhouxiangella sediminis]|jgi:large subunit ribosomal protein L32|uniref:Large ribosomal subunit protein bL32 n=1 Tax=Wenzhouxiangella sediminis TaxID=1792836 RepID=A0A3E1KBX0_9GAMM|nr:50S ribosomal protein L32 [Wenzhouxiangella sediminis]MEE4304563.1 50S ribosomal protein L32 [Wenzhouxiangella sp.]RFF32204.1 50S ribosomal protein L32 [Wenzhouxiangella sediminis]
MAVQKSRKTPSRRGMRRSHDGLSGPTLSEESTTGEIHRRHHVSAEGFYRGRQVVEVAPEIDEEDLEETQG